MKFFFYIYNFALILFIFINMKKILYSLKKNKVYWVDQIWTDISHFQKMMFCQLNYNSKKNNLCSPLPLPNPFAALRTRQPTQRSCKTLGQA